MKYEEIPEAAEYAGCYGCGLGLEGRCPYTRPKNRGNCITLQNAAKDMARAVSMMQNADNIGAQLAEAAKALRAALAGFDPEIKANSLAIKELFEDIEQAALNTEKCLNDMRLCKRQAPEPDPFLEMFGPEAFE